MCRLHYTSQRDAFVTYCANNALFIKLLQVPVKTRRRPSLVDRVTYEVYEGSGVEGEEGGRNCRSDRGMDKRAPSSMTTEVQSDNNLEKVTPTLAELIMAEEGYSSSKSDQGCSQIMDDDGGMESKSGDILRVKELLTGGNRISGIRTIITKGDGTETNPENNRWGPR